MVRTFDGDAQRRDEAFEQHVRDALRAEAETVELSGDGLHEIRSRTPGSATRRAHARWLTGATAALATAAAVTAIAEAASLDLGLGGTESPGPAAPATSGQALAVFYLDNTPERRGEPGSVTVGTPGLYREIHDVSVSGSRVEAAVRELVGSTPEDRDYANPWAGTTVHSVQDDAAIPVVDVDALPASGDKRDAAMQALAQTVNAASQAGDVSRVTVEVDGTVARRVSVAQPLGTYANIWVTSPEQGAAVSSPVTFSGFAATFEGNVAYEITRESNGEVVAGGATITQGGMGVWSEWSFGEQLAPGTYEVTAFDEDAALGGRRDVETKTFTVE